MLYHDDLNQECNNFATCHPWQQKHIPRHPKYTCIQHLNRNYRKSLYPLSYSLSNEPYRSVASWFKRISLMLFILQLTFIDSSADTFSNNDANRPEFWISGRGCDFENSSMNIVEISNISTITNWYPVWWWIKLFQSILSMSNAIVMDGYCGTSDTGTNVLPLRVAYRASSYDSNVTLPARILQ